MGSFPRRYIVTVSAATVLSLSSCQQVDSLKGSLVSATSSSNSSKRSESTPSCDPGFSLAGFFDSRADVLIEKPAKFPQAGDLRRVAVIPPTGDGSDAYTRQLESALTSVHSGGQPYFQVVTRTDLEKVMKAQGFSQSGAVAPGSAAKVGRLLGVQGIYIPQIIEHKVADSAYQKSDKGGGQCTKRTVSFKTIPKLVDVSTGQVVFAEQYGDSREERYCESGGGIDGQISQLKSFMGQGGLPEGEVVMGEIMAQAMDEFVTDIAPRSCMKKMNIMDETDDLGDEVAAEKFEAAVAFMEAGRYDRACPSWQAMEASGEKAVALYNNLALCAEIEEKLLVARDYCGKADALLTWPSDDINLCIDTVERRLTESAALRVAGCGPLVNRADVREVQQILDDLGYLKGAADGVVGPGTLSAVIDFQTEKGLPIEGRVDACLLDDLRSL